MKTPVRPSWRLGWMAAGRWQARVEMLKYVQTRSNERISQLAVTDFIASLRLTAICAACVVRCRRNGTSQRS